MNPDSKGTSRIYGTRKLFLIPLAADNVLALILTLLAFTSGATSMEKTVMSAIFIVLVLLLLESLFRRAVIKEEGIVIERFLRKKQISWQEITNVDALVLRKKIYLLLTSTRGLQIISNNLSHFSGIVSDILSRVEDEKIEPAAREISKVSIARISDIVLLWVAAVLMVGAIWYKVYQ